jgi:hypothetical protein
MYLSLFICLVGLVMYLLCTTPNKTYARASAIGFEMFRFGMLAFLITGGGEKIALLFRVQ